jgi:hypothetical protein
VGQIISGHSAGWYVYVDPVEDLVDQYLLYVANTPNLFHAEDAEVYDYWLESPEELQVKFAAFEWAIEWLE